MEKYKVFYSWQSDSPNATNRGFIQKALENAAKAIRQDDSIRVEPVVDRDTAGVPGSPDIASTIFAKIDESDVFVPDVSIINRGQSVRTTPNPNVLLELGYAFKALGSERIILVMNTAFGGPELLPFDLSKKRVVTYHMAEEAENRAGERRALGSKLEEALRMILSKIESEAPARTKKLLSVGDEARQAVEGGQQTAVLPVRRFMDWLSDEIRTLAPEFSKEKKDEWDEALVAGINQTIEYVIDFGRLAQLIAIMDNSQAGTALYKSFQKILGRYYVPRGFSGVVPEHEFDFYKFMGHELFITFASFLIQEERWELLSSVLEEQLYLQNRPWGGPGLVSFTYISKHVGLLGHRNKRLELKRMSVHADTLKARHSEGDLAEFVPMQAFMEADYFLFLRSVLTPDKPEWGDMWKPWSTIYMGSNAPAFLGQATQKSYAERLLRPLGVPNIEKLKELLPKRAGMVAHVFGDGFWCDLNPLEYFDVNKIGST
ncbi:MAG: hypothetical protein ACYTEL_03015 [Planctomycetota bacterium]|jgi:hypothetical protein